MLTVSVSATAVPVQLQNGTATFSQGPFGGGPYNPQMAIDGIFYAGTMCCSNGWTIERFPGDFAANETAVWQTVSDVGPSFFTFTMYFLDPNPGHLLGRSCRCRRADVLAARHSDSGGCAERNQCAKMVDQSRRCCRSFLIRTFSGG